MSGSWEALGSLIHRVLSLVQRWDVKEANDRFAEEKAREMGLIDDEPPHEPEE